MSCLAYAESSSLGDRVWGDESGTFLTLVYCDGCSQPSFWQCCLKDGQHEGAEDVRVPFDISAGEATVEVTIFFEVLIF